MKFTLKDYQEEAVGQVLDRLRKARKRWHEDGERNAFALSATTGAGKTVMAAAVFEALFHGHDEFDFPADPGAVVIWFSDDPSLNTQSMWRLLEASDKLTVSDLVAIDTGFTRDRLEAGKIYFLNTQKLSKNSLLVRGHDPEAAKDGQQRLMPDDRAFTIWDIIQNTIETPGLTLYLVLDEAHRGLREGKGSGADGKPTIVRQLINGMGSVPGIPVVWGISATIDRFTRAMEGAKGRATLAPVEVDARKVQESGLLKDSIVLDFSREETGDFNTVLLRRATDKLKDISEAWAAYAKAQDSAAAVQPLMVLQVPNAPSANEIGEWLDVIFAQWPELPQDCVANVFGEHRTERFGRHDVPYVEPQRVQETEQIRILVAKDAISTGWDCPRAEVMISFRAATDETHITQLLGRMVRTPLARRIPGNDRLNAVDCILPKFRKETVESIVKSLTEGEPGEALPIRRVLINPVEVTPNTAIPQDVWNSLLALPSQVMPRKHARPVKRLTILAHELAVDGIVEGAGQKAHQALHAHLDRLMEELSPELAKHRASVLEVEGTSLRYDRNTGARSFDDFVEAADMNVIDDAYRQAGRIISPDVARSYAEHLADGLGMEDEIDALMEAHVVVASLGLVTALKDRLDAEAERIANEWLGEHAAALNALPDERQDIYRDIRAMSAKPLDTIIAPPKSWMQPTTERQPNGTEKPLDRYEKHLLCDGEGQFPVDYGSAWEKKVLSVELGQDGLLGWYRNPGRPSQDSLGITYEEDGETKIMRPDFIFFVRQADGTVAVEIVDPHDHSKADALPKLRGLARYAAANAGNYRRIEAVAEVDGTYRALDLTKAEVRAAVEAAASAKLAYLGAAAKNYGS